MSLLGTAQWRGAGDTHNGLRFAAIPLSGYPMTAGHDLSGFRRIPTGGISETSKTDARMQPGC